jgi:hypothetical protein
MCQVSSGELGLLDRDIDLGIDAIESSPTSASAPPCSSLASTTASAKAIDDCQIKFAFCRLRRKDPNITIDIACKNIVLCEAVQSDLWQRFAYAPAIMFPRH